MNACVFKIEKLHFKTVTLTKFQDEHAKTMEEDTMLF